MRRQSLVVRGIFFVVASLVLMPCMSQVADAGNSTTQSISWAVNAIDQIAVSGQPGSLTVSTATAGSDPTPATDATTTWAVSTNSSTNRAITGAIDSAMPSGVTLSVNLASAGGGTSAGTVALTATAQNLVTGLHQEKDSGAAITYTLSATLAAAVGSGTKTVTLTLQ